MMRCPRATLASLRMSMALPPSSLAVSGYWLHKYQTMITVARKRKPETIGDTYRRIRPTTAAIPVTTIPVTAPTAIAAGRDKPESPEHTGGEGHSGLIRVVLSTEQGRQGLTVGHGPHSTASGHSSQGLHGLSPGQGPQGLTSGQVPHCPVQLISRHGGTIGQVQLQIGQASSWSF
jgi:hypothetical protein